MSILLGMEDANVMELDRWVVRVTGVVKPFGTKAMYVIPIPRWDLTFTEDPSMAAGGSKEDTAKPMVEPHSLVLNNYMGIGLDAAIALDFHLAREENPAKFNSRWVLRRELWRVGINKRTVAGRH